MADTADAVNKLKDEVENLSVDSVKNSTESGPGNALESGTHAPELWGFPLNELYKLGLKFYKDKEGKAISLSYHNKLLLVSYNQQNLHGPFNQEKTTPLGVLDVIGRDRRDAWQALGDMSKSMAMTKFIELLDSSCPAFKPFVEAQKADKEEKARRAVVDEEKRKVEVAQEAEREAARRRDEEEQAAAEARKRQIQEALNEQTFHQFRAYAEEQYPGNPEQQAVLVRQLQEQHYHQYMQQLMQQQHQAVQTNTVPAATNMAAGHSPTQQGSEGEDLLDDSRETDAVGNGVEGSEDENDDGLPRVSPPSMWTRKDIKDFKESIRKEGGDAIIKVGHGETVTVRVPTHEDGTCLFWEFATDSYDIGFGVYFEWTKSATNQVSVHIQDSEDDEDLDDEDDQDDDDLAEFAEQADIEKGSRLDKLADLKDKPLLSAIVPIYRRDCQDEVYAGSHDYPGQGVYLLKFDNSYSLWRSKTLYYRVYYTR